MKRSTVACHAFKIAGTLATGSVALAACLLLPRKPKRGQVVVITGGSRGLGFALAEQYARSGAQLVLCARNTEELEQARRSLVERHLVRSPEDVLLVTADLTDAAQASRLIDSALSAFGRIDILINNAGIIQVGPVENQPIEAYELAMRTNFFSALYTIHAVLPHLLSRRAGAIVNIASIGGKFAMPHMLPYVASKFALVGFSEGLHAELRYKGVRVTTVCPGLMRTGGETHAQFVGQKEKEQRWFNLAAKTPLIAASVRYAARRIVTAVAEGRAEITITPQAWGAARKVGLMPETVQWGASLINHYLLPDPASSSAEQPITPPVWVDTLQPTANEL